MCQAQLLSSVLIRSLSFAVYLSPSSNSREHTTPVPTPAGGYWLFPGGLPLLPTAVIFPPEKALIKQGQRGSTFLYYSVLPAQRKNVRLCKRPAWRSFSRCACRPGKRPRLQAARLRCHRGLAEPGARWSFQTSTPASTAFWKKKRIEKLYNNVINILGIEKGTIP